VTLKIRAASAQKTDASKTVHFAFSETETTVLLSNSKLNLNYWVGEKVLALFRSVNSSTARICASLELYFCVTK
jgi:hypothetical protein